jgi:hypothetical protein
MQLSRFREQAWMKRRQFDQDVKARRPVRRNGFDRRGLD